MHRVSFTSMISILIVFIVVTGTSSRVTELNFEEAEVEDIFMTGCHPGFITNRDHTCTLCPPGTFANTIANPQSCDHCPYNTYSSDKGATECVECGEGLGTLEEGASSESDCVAICEIPMMDNVARTTPEYRVEEEEEVIIDCAEGYHYGNKGRVVVTCSSSVNNFPESCRRLNIRTAGPPSIVTGERAKITCTIETSEKQYGVQWYQDTPPYVVEVSNRSKYMVETTSEVRGYDAAAFMMRTSVLTIFDFSSQDVASYSCGALFEAPLQNDYSPHLSLHELHVTMTPDDTQILAASEKSFIITCAMSLDNYFDSRYMTWGHHTYHDVFSEDINPTTRSITVYTNETHHVSLQHLTDVTVYGAGTYTCHTTYSRGVGFEDRVTQSRSVEVRVRGAEIKPGYQVVEVGAGVQLSCVVEGEQRAHIEWTSPNETSTKLNITSDLREEHFYLVDMVRTTSVITLYPDKTNYNTNGSYVYQCEASFGHEDAMKVTSAVATVVVKDFGIAENPTNKTLYVGGNAKLSCKVKSSDVHPAAVRWRKSSDSDIIDDTKINFRNRKSSGRSTSTLTLKSVTEDDAGEYSCEAVYVIDGKLIVRESNTAILHIKRCEDLKKKCRNLSKESKKKRKKMCRKTSWQESCPESCKVC